MKNIFFLYQTGGDKAIRSAEVMAHMIYEALSESNKIFMLVKTDKEQEFAQKRNIKYFDLRRYKLIIFNSLIRIAHVLPIDSILQIFYKDLYAFMKTHRIDIILERHSIFNIGYVLSRKHKCKYVCSEKLAFPDLPYYTHGLKNKIMIMFPLPYCLPLIKIIEGLPFKKADRIISQHEKYNEYLIKNYHIKNDNFSRYFAVVDKNKFQASKLKKSKFIVTYIGSFDSLHSAENIMPIIIEANKLNKNIYFQLIGDGPMLNKIKEQIKSLGLSDICSTTGRVPHDQIVEYIQFSTVCFETIWNDRVKKFGADSYKIYEYMACGKIIIASDLPGQIQELKNKNAGILIDPTNTKLFAETLDDIYKNQDKYSELGINARRLVDESWNNDYTKQIFKMAVAL